MISVDALKLYQAYHPEKQIQMLEFRKLTTRYLLEVLYLKDPENAELVKTISRKEVEATIRRIRREVKYLYTTRVPTPPKVFQVWALALRKSNPQDFYLHFIEGLPLISFPRSIENPLRPMRLFPHLFLQNKSELLDYIKTLRLCIQLGYKMD